MGEIESRLAAMGLSLPPLVAPRNGRTLPFVPVHICGTRLLFSGHAPQRPDGYIARPFGKLGAELGVDEGYHAARLAAIGLLGTLQRALGDLDRVTRWHRVFGMVNSAPGFTRQNEVMNGFSDLILELYGPERGQHTRSAVGMAGLPFDIPLEIEGELSIRD